MPRPTPAKTILEAEMRISAAGRIVDVSPETLAWWRVGDRAELVGRPFVALFFFEAPGGGGDPAAEAWALLESAATAGPLTLQARVEDGGFEVIVQLLPHSRGTPAVGNQPAYLARLERTDFVETAPLAPAAPEEENEKPMAPHRPAARPLRVAERAQADASDTESEELSADDDTALTTEDPGDSEGRDRDTDDADKDSGEEAASAADALPNLAAWRSRIRGERRPSSRAPEAEATSSLAALDGGAIGVFDLDVTAGTAQFSDAWRNLLGYDADDVGDEPDTLGALFHPDDSEAAPKLETRGRPGTRLPYSAEARLRAKDGAWRWMQIDGVQRFDDDGRLARLTGVMLDAQERHDAEDEMLRAEERFRRLVGHGRLAFFELDLVEDAGAFSPEFRHALGYTAKELPATPDGFLRLLAPEDAEPGAAAFFGGLADTAQRLSVRYRLQHKDGRWLEFDALLAAERNRRGEVERVIALQAPASGEAPTVGVSAAASPERATSSPGADALVEAARQALDAVAEAVVLTDDGARIVHANTRALQWAGGEPGKVHGRTVDEVFPLFDRETRTPALEVVQRVIGGSHALELDHRFAVAETEGSRADVVITCRPLFDLRKRVAGAIVVLRKPSEMPLSPAELVASNRMETLGRLACGIAHDFNNVLTTVTGSISLALDKRDWAPLSPAQKALETARNLARQLLTFARGKSAERKVQALNPIIKETARLTGAGSKIAVELELADDIYPVNVDAVQIVQVFTNLILNAMQVMPDGGHIWVRTLRMALGRVNSVDLPPGDYVRIDVQDDGPGIPPENLAHIFEPFFSTRSGGTGLGLAMVNSIIAQHEGAIEAVSTVGKGTTFTLFLPRALSEPAKETRKPMSVSYGTGRILVMDDDPDLCMIAKGMLEVLGYEADTAQTAADAIAAFRRLDTIGRRYGAVILDLTMVGGPGGEEVLVKLREIDPDVRAIVSSGYATDEQVERYAELGFKGVLAKPYRSSDLGRVLKEVLGLTPKQP